MGEIGNHPAIRSIRTKVSLIFERKIKKERCRKRRKKRVSEKKEKRKREKNKEKKRVYIKKGSEKGRE